MSVLSNTATVDIPHVTWEEFLSTHFRWYQGEHIAAIGPTGSGKTTLILALLPYRKYVTMIGTKPKDETLMRLVKENHYHLMRRWEKYSPTVYPRRVLWPDATKLGSIASQRNEILIAMREMYSEGHWCVVIDELWYFIHQLKLELTVKTYLQQARSIGISLVAGTQRPAFVPLEIYDQSTHLFFWRDNDERNLKRISGVAWLSARMIMRVIASLEKHEVLYINTRTGAMIRTMSPPPKKETNRAA